MKYSKLSRIALIIFIAMITVLSWHSIGTPLNDEFYQLSGAISDITTNLLEIAKYAIISLLISIVILLPFYQDKLVIPKLSYPYVLFVLTLLFTCAAYFLDQNVKGIYLVNHIGDDFPFIFYIILFFLLFPFVLYLLIVLLVNPIRIRNIFGFFMIGIFSCFLSYLENGNFPIFSINYFRKVISEGHFLFWITSLLGFQFWFMYKKHPSKDEFQNILDHDS